MKKIFSFLILPLTLLTLLSCEKVELDTGEPSCLPGGQPDSEYILDCTGSSFRILTGKAISRTVLPSSGFISVTTVDGGASLEISCLSNPSLEERSVILTVHYSDGERSDIRLLQRGCGSIMESDILLVEDGAASFHVLHPGQWKLLRCSSGKTEAEGCGSVMLTVQAYPGDEFDLCIGDDRFPVLAVDSASVERIALHGSQALGLDLENEYRFVHFSKSWITLDGDGVRLRENAGRKKRSGILTLSSRSSGEMKRIVVDQYGSYPDDLSCGLYMDGDPVVVCGGETVLRYRDNIAGRIIDAEFTDSDGLMCLFKATVMLCKDSAPGDQVEIRTRGLAMQFAEVSVTATIESLTSSCIRLAWGDYYLSIDKSVIIQ